MRTLFITLACLSALTARAKKDLIVFRDGTEKIVQIKQVNSDKTLFLEGKGKNATTQVVENTGIYMIKYERRGNVFFTEDGDRFTSKTSISFMPSNTVALYLKKGEEILLRFRDGSSYCEIQRRQQKEKCSKESAQKRCLYD